MSAALTIGLLAGVLAVPGIAHADADLSVTTREFSYNADQLRTATRPSEALSGARSAKVQAGIAEHLDTRVRTGRLVDQKKMKTAVLADPTKPGAENVLVWDGASAPIRVDVAEALRGTVQGAAGYGVQWAQEGPDSTPTSTTGGFLGAVSTSNMTLKSDDCGTWAFSPQYSSSASHWMTSCYQKYKKSGTSSEWVYNRWMLWTPAPTNSGERRYTTDLTIRARPWSGSSSSMTGPKGWLPEAGSTHCNSSTNLTLSVTNGSVTIPIRKCDEHTVLINTTRREFGLDYSGRTGDNQMRLDAAAKFTATSTSVNLSFADYNWAAVQWCSDPFGVLCDPSFTMAHKDSGW